MAQRGAGKDIRLEKALKYPALEGWINPPLNKPFKMLCCGCGLVHKIQFQIVDNGKHVLFKVDIDHRATGQARRWRKNEQRPAHTLSPGI